MTNRPTTSPLEQLLGERDAREFLARAWPNKSYFESHGPLTRLPAFARSELFSSPRQICTAYRGVFQAGSNSGAYPGQVRLANTSSWLFFHMGLTVYLREVRDMLAAQDPSVMPWLIELSKQLGLPAESVDVGVFASPSEGEGLKAHYDTEEGFLLQLFGEKTVQIAPPPIPFPPAPKFGDLELERGGYPAYVDGFPDRATALSNAVEIHMKPGSVLYVPMGWWHSTSCKSPSMGMKIQWTPPRAFEVLLNGLKQHLTQSEAWRRPLYGAWGSRRDLADEATAELNRLIGELPAILAHLPIDGMIEGWHETLAPRRVHEGSYFQRVPGTRLSTTEPSNNVFVLTAHAFGDRAVTELELDAELKPTIDWLAERSAAFSLGDLARQSPELPSADLLELLSAMCDADVLVALAYVPLPRS